MEDTLNTENQDTPEIAHTIAAVALVGFAAVGIGTVTVKLGNRVGSYVRYRKDRRQFAKWQNTQDFKNLKID